MAHPKLNRVATNKLDENTGRQNGDLGTRLRRLRTLRQLSLEQVATNTGLSTSFISLLERGQTDVSVLRLERLLGFYGISLSEFFFDADDPSPPEINPITSFPSVDRGDGVGYYVIRPDHPQVISVRLEPWASFSDLRAHQGEDFWVLCEGQVTLLYGEKRYSLVAPSTARISGTVPHGLENQHPEPAHLVVVTTVPYW